MTMFRSGLGRGSSNVGGMWHPWGILAAFACSAGSGCWDDVELPANTSTFGGQVVISGGLRGARVTIDQLDLHTGEIRIPLGETVTNAAGYFSVDTGTENGLFLVASRAGRTKM